MTRRPSEATRRAQAIQRSEALLRELLPPEEYTCYTERRYLEVRSQHYPGRVYHIPPSGALVTVFERGEPVNMLCIGPAEALPPADLVIMHKLLIESDESTYLQIANHLRLGFEDLPMAQRLMRLTQES